MKFGNARSDSERLARTQHQTVATKLNCNTHVWIFMFSTLTEYRCWNCRENKYKLCKCIRNGSNGDVLCSFCRGNRRTASAKRIKFLLTFHSTPSIRRSLRLRCRFNFLGLRANDLLRCMLLQSKCEFLPCRCRCCCLFASLLFNMKMTTNCANDCDANSAADNSFCVVVTKRKAQIVNLILLK